MPSHTYNGRFIAGKVVNNTAYMAGLSQISHISINTILFSMFQPYHAVCFTILFGMLSLCHQLFANNKPIQWSIANKYDSELI